MNTISTDQILSQIRALNSELQSPVTNTPIAKESVAFGELLQNTMATVNETQQTAGRMQVAFSAGSTDASLAEVMVAAQKADLSFRAMAEVRNKLINAYQEIMNMPV